MCRKACRKCRKVSESFIVFLQNPTRFLKRDDYYKVQ
nr:MAG TPA: Thymidine kinase [Caudoviricetes sp.]